MSYNELYEHKKSDTVKWVLTLIAFIVVGVLIAGLIAGWFDKGEDSLPVQDETATIQDGGMSVTPSAANGIRLMAAERTATDVSPLAETSYTITATIEPASARQNADWYDTLGHLIYNNSQHRWEYHHPQQRQHHSASIKLDTAPQK